MSSTLPQGYEARVDQATQRVYYLNHRNGTTSWEPPASARSEAVVVVAEPQSEAGSAYMLSPAPAPLPAPAGRNQQYVAYQAPDQGNSSEAPASRPASGVKQVASRSYALTKSLLVGQVAPSLLSKSGELTLDGRCVYVKLSRGVLTILSSRKEKDAKIIFRAPMKYIIVCGDASTRKQRRQVGRGREIAPNEIALFAEPEALNQEVNAQSNSGMHMGWFPGHLRTGATIAETGLTAHDMKRQNFSLYAPTPTDKQNWRITLNTAANSLRSWSYVFHEISDCWAYTSGKKK